MSRPDDELDALAEGLDVVDLTEVFDLQPLPDEQIEWVDRARRRLRAGWEQLRRKDRK